MAIVTHEVASWGEFKKRVIKDQFEDGLFRRGRFLFRGQGDAAWPLTSSFDRWFQGEASKKFSVAEGLIEFFKAECEQYDLPSAFDNSKNSWLGLAQHHGLPTRLLDWSESPYVAAVFAFGGHLRSNNTETSNVAIRVIDTTSHVWTEDLGCAIISVPSYGNARIANQFGKFTYLRSPVSSIEEYVAQFNESNKCVIREYIIPVSEAKKAIGDLDAMGLTYSRIYPGLVGNAMAAEVRAALSLS